MVIGVGDRAHHGVTARVSRGLGAAAVGEVHTQAGRGGGRGDRLSRAVVSLTQPAQCHGGRGLADDQGVRRRALVVGVGNGGDDRVAADVGPGRGPAIVGHAHRQAGRGGGDGDGPGRAVISLTQVIQRDDGRARVDSENLADIGRRVIRSIAGLAGGNGNGADTREGYRAAAEGGHAGIRRDIADRQPAAGGGRQGERPAAVGPGGKRAEGDRLRHQHDVETLERGRGGIIAETTPLGKNTTGQVRAAGLVRHHRDQAGASRSQDVVGDRGRPVDDRIDDLQPGAGRGVEHDRSIGGRQVGDGLEGDRLGNQGYIQSHHRLGGGLVIVVAGLVGQDRDGAVRFDAHQRIGLREHGGAVVAQRQGHRQPGAGGGRHRDGVGELVERDGVGHGQLQVDGLERLANDQRIGGPAHVARAGDPRHHGVTAHIGRRGGRTVVGDVHTEAGRNGAGGGAARRAVVGLAQFAQRHGGGDPADHQRIGAAADVISRVDRADDGVAAGIRRRAGTAVVGHVDRQHHRRGDGRDAARRAVVGLAQVAQGDGGRGWPDDQRVGGAAVIIGVRNGRDDRIAAGIGRRGRVAAIGYGRGQIRRLRADGDRPGGAVIGLAERAQHHGGRGRIYD